MAETGDDKFRWCPESLWLHTSTLVVINSEAVRNLRQQSEHDSKPVQGQQKLYQLAKRHDWRLVRRCHKRSTGLHFVTVAVCDCNGLDNENKSHWRSLKMDWSRLDYADDIALIETSQTCTQQLTRKIEKTSGSVGLRMNAESVRLWSALIGRTIQQ